MSLKKTCPGCGKIIDMNQKYCDKCQQEYEARQKEKEKRYDTEVRYKRDKKYHDFYNSPEWVNIREYVLTRYKRLDLYAFYILKEIVYADTVHHIEELKENWDRRLDTKNLFPISNSNHIAIHTMYEKDKKGTKRLLFELLERWEKEYERN